MSPAAIVALVALVACSGAHGVKTVGSPIGTRQQILLVGDSITARDGSPGPTTDGQHQKLINLFTAAGRTVTLLGSLGTAPRKHEGVGGDNILDVQARWAAAASAITAGGGSPNLIWLEIGINDCEPFEPNHSANSWTSAAGKKEELRTLIQTIKASFPSATLVLPTVTPATYAAGTYGDGYRANIAALNAVLPALASEESITYIDLFALFTNPATQIEATGVHPTALGYTIIANAIYAQVAGP